MRQHLGTYFAGAKTAMFPKGLVFGLFSRPQLHYFLLAAQQHQMP